MKTFTVELDNKGSGLFKIYFKEVSDELTNADIACLTSFLFNKLVEDYSEKNKITIEESCKYVYESFIKDIKYMKDTKEIQ